MRCRRNPAVSGLAASVALALILGVVVFDRLRPERREIAPCEAANRTIAERQERFCAEKAEKGVIIVRDDTERTFARSLARPLNPRGVGDPVLSEPEIEALWEAQPAVANRSERAFSTRRPATRRSCARSRPAPNRS